MIKPNYKNGSIVNLVSSIKKALGGKSKYKPLKDFDISHLSNKNIVLIVIDGLGYNYLKTYGKNSFLYKNLKGKMTSVFPATTVAAMTTFSTGFAPQQHALTGWFMFLKEIGMVLRILSFTSRAGDLKLGAGGIEYNDIYNVKSFCEDLKITSAVVMDREYIGSSYTCLSNRGAKRIPFSNLSGFFRQIKKALSVGTERKYVLAYWAKLDSLCHKGGTKSREARKHFDELDNKIRLLTGGLRNQNTTIIVTADHGLIDTNEKSKVIELKKHPQFVETLAMPLTGEPRVVYCYVRPQKVKQFETYVRTNFGKCCEIYKSDELIKNNYFGLYKQNPKLKDRIGDYVLIMKDNYIMKDFVLGEKRKIDIGHHGGVSEEEMFVPLVVIE